MRQKQIYVTHLSPVDDIPGDVNYFFISVKAHTGTALKLLTFSTYAFGKVWSNFMVVDSCVQTFWPFDNVPEIVDFSGQNPRKQNKLWN